VCIERDQFAVASHFTFSRALAIGLWLSFTIKPPRVTWRFSILAIMRNPSHFLSNTQSRLSNGASMSVVSIGRSGLETLDGRSMAQE
jgi:hypothetical protein